MASPDNQLARERLAVSWLKYTLANRIRGEVVTMISQDVVTSVSRGDLLDVLSAAERGSSVGFSEDDDLFPTGEYPGTDFDFTGVPASARSPAHDSDLCTGPICTRNRKHREEHDDS